MLPVQSMANAKSKMLESCWANGGLSTVPVAAESPLIFLIFPSFNTLTSTDNLVPIKSVIFRPQIGMFLK